MFLSQNGKKKMGKKVNRNVLGWLRSYSRSSEGKQTIYLGGLTCWPVSALPFLAAHVVHSQSLAEAVYLYLVLWAHFTKSQHHW